MNSDLLVGIGGAGCALALACGERLDLPVLAVNSDDEALTRSRASQKLLLRAGQARKPASGVLDIHRAAQRSSRTFRRRLRGIRHVFLIAGLGGATGSHAMPTLGRTALDAGCTIACAVTMPFSIEAGRQAIAAGALRSLQELHIPLFVHEHAAAECDKPDASLGALLEMSADAIRAVVEEWRS